MKKEGGAPTLVWMLVGLFLFAIVYFLGMSLAKVYLPAPYKCWLMTCELASWEEIQQVALANVRANEVISGVSVHTRENFESAELGKVDISVTYTDNSKSGDNAKYTYRERVLVFDDRTLSARDLNMMMTSTEPGSVEFQTQFLTTKLGPREAYRVFWDRLQSSPYLKNVRSVMISLSFGKEESKSAEKLVWLFYCLMNKGILAYEVDAETGKITYETVSLRP